ncbi:MAG: sulfate transporter CysZ [Gammaproteobacteria bacterium]|nr:sulfate transporter CysZ [Gammaproteobacteria bacterium]
MSNSPFRGAQYFLMGLSLITKPGIRKFAALPLLINVLVFSVLIVFAWQQYQALAAFVEQWLPGWLSWLHWLLLPLFILTILIMVIFTFSWLANFIGGFFNGLLAEAVERHLTGKEIEPPSTPGYPFVKELIGSLLYPLRWIIVLVLITLIPGINAIAPILWFVFGAWMLSIEYADNPMGNHNIAPSVQRKMLAGKRMVSLGFGSTALAATMIPVVNFIVMPVGVAGATYMWVREFAQSSEQSSQ